jgi:hypothetical protein
VWNKEKKERRRLGNQEFREENILEVVLGIYELRNLFFFKRILVYMYMCVSASFRVFIKLLAEILRKEMEGNQFGSKRIKELRLWEYIKVFLEKYDQEILFSL